MKILEENGIEDYIFENRTSIDNLSFFCLNSIIS